tara:strand:- start:345 stop:485 length:141 start_codon:yes stop_codon:yes gene_type:complete
MEDDKKTVCLCGKEGCDGTDCQCGTDCGCKPKTEEDELKELGVAPI